MHNYHYFHPINLLSYVPDNIIVVLGSLIKLIYFSRHEELSQDDKRRRFIKKRLGIFNGKRRSCPILGGRLHFVKFETGKLNECLDFISSKQLHLGGMHILSIRYCLLTTYLRIKWWYISWTNKVEEIYFLYFFLYSIPYNLIHSEMCN